MQSAVIAISRGSTAAPPSSWDKGCPDKHHIPNLILPPETFDIMLFAEEIDINSSSGIRGLNSNTVNVDIFVLYIFLRNLPFLNICENMLTSKITFIIA